MGRRSLKAERREQILEAFGRCVAEHGLAGTTLERVAEHAGLNRPAIRHNVGNRDALIEAALERITNEHREAYRAAVEALPDRGRVEAMLEYLFLGGFSDPVDEEDVILDELFAVRHREPKVAALLGETYRELERTIASELRREHPDVPAPACREAAYAIMALAFGHSTFAGMGLARRSRSQGALDRALAIAAEPGRNT